MAKTKITREYFLNLIKDVSNWESCLTDLQKQVTKEWLYNNKSFTQIARELNVNHRMIQKQIKGDNQFGTNGAIRAIIRYKAGLTKGEIKK